VGISLGILLDIVGGKFTTRVGAGNLRIQATIPKMVRETLNLASGDRVEFLIAPDGAVRLRKAPEPASELQALEATLAHEWSSDDDDTAYAGL
jgi:AbrB family looped-hinge helix DNA binding protein